MKIAAIGLGYVGLANALLLAQQHEVIAYDVLEEKINLLNDKISPIKDEEISEFLMRDDLNIEFTNDFRKITKCELCIIATPTNYDDEKNYFDTSSVDQTIERVIKINPEALILIKSTIPIGYINMIRKRQKNNNIIFSPEFLRESKALYDNLYPSRIVIGEKSERARKLAEIFESASFKKEVQILLTNPTEAEAIKLFANTYLAMRVAFFNELDIFAISKNLDTKDIIDGICLDPRIGAHYNNPSFGYGGYCLPKDTKQLLANYSGIPNKLMRAIVDSNQTRKEYVVQQIIDKKPKTVGIYRLTMKINSDNFRSSSIRDIMKGIKKQGIDIIIYEPNLEKKEEFESYKVENNLDKFKTSSDIIVANRINKDDLRDVMNKIYSRDLYGEN